MRLIDLAVTAFTLSLTRARHVSVRSQRNGPSAWWWRG